MTTQITIPAKEKGVVRIFSVNPPEPFNPADDDAPQWLLTALGLSHLPEESYELFPIRQLDGIGLSGYLTEGWGISTDELAQLAPQLDALKDHVLLLRPNAFDTETTLAVQQPVRYVATLQEDRPPVHFDALPSGSAELQLAETPQKQPSEAAIMGRVAMVALLVLFALVGLMIWIA
ncbi:hypothetical protein [Pseudaestuariivita rosea]|uniref:hypothetical protein n=1 Tax=Pseudaestuariivita rosea TaxID=2763263 RepID=UPI001ABB6EC8|nr:hypothetical protein [Pseudaestuariivita rosea]